MNAPQKPDFSGMYDRHPLTKKRKAGPRSAEAEEPADEALGLAQEVLGCVQAGVLQPMRDSLSWREQLGKVGRTLTKEQEEILAFHVQTYGDVDARNILITKNMGLVQLSIPKTARGGPHAEDMVHEGVLGLIRAAEQFTPTRGLRFSTYCVWWIRAKIQRFRQMQQKHDEPTVTDTTNKNNVRNAPGASLYHTDEFGKRARRRNVVTRLDAPLSVDGESIGDTFASDSTTQEEDMIQSEYEGVVREVLAGIVEEMPASRRALAEAVVKNRLLAEEPWTLAELGDHLGYSREGARLCEKGIMRELSCRLDALGLHSKDTQHEADCAARSTARETDSLWKKRRARGAKRPEVSGV